MSKDGFKKITAEVTKDCWKVLKMLAVQKEVSLQQIATDILEKSVSKKKNVSTDINIED